MMKIAAIVVAALLVNLLLSLLVGPYRDLLIMIGRRISYGNDIADLPRIFMIGFAVSGTVVAAAAVAIVRFTRPRPASGER
jgi:hypothetical protein